MPLGLAFIASLLREQGQKVSIFDRHACQSRIGTEKDKINSTMLQHIEKWRPDLIGLQTISPLIYDTVECVELIRRIYAGPIIAGGHHVTALPEITLNRIPGLSGVVIGEGELPMARMAKGEDPGIIPGFRWETNGVTIGNLPPAKNQDLDELPFPAMDLLDMAYYTQPTVNTIRGHFLSSVCVLASRGCSNRCDFCSESLTYGKGVRFHSAEYVIEWITRIVRDYKVEGIYFHDNDFLISETRARQICEKILSKGLDTKIKWAIQARADRINRKILRLLKRSGCVLVEIGVESSSQAQLNSVAKRATVCKNAEAVGLCRKERMPVHAYMMFDFEGEVMSDLDEKLRWVKKTKPNSFGWGRLIIHPGTQLYNRRGKSFFEKNDWNEKNILAYYNGNSLSRITRKKRSLWMKKYYLPYQAWRHAINILKMNSFTKLIDFFCFEKSQCKRLAIASLRYLLTS
jgi:anaerobic magnesium-protoporphyrin IX monomethyl ester cyclase